MPLFLGGGERGGRRGRGLGGDPRNVLLGRVVREGRG